MFRKWATKANDKGLANSCCGPTIQIKRTRRTAAQKGKNGVRLFRPLELPDTTCNLDAASDQTDRPGGWPHFAGMSEAPVNRELARQLAVLEERMERTEDRLQGALDRFRAVMARLSEGMARRDTEAAKRETRLIVTIAGLMIGIGGLAVALLGFLIRLPS